MKDITVRPYNPQVTDYHKALKTEPVYGPINSRRLGLSLGINPIQGGFACNFGCGYCQYGIDDIAMIMARTKNLRFTQPLEIEVKLENRLQTKEHYDSLTLCGPTEPTLHPEFDKIVAIMVRLRDKYRPEIPTSLFTNASRLIGLDTYPLDYVFMKLDAGNEETFQRVNRPHGKITLAKIVEQIMGAKVKSRIIQTMMIGGEDGNFKKENLKDYMNLLRIINPAEVHLYSILYAPPPRVDVKHVDREKLDDLAKQIEAEVSTKALVFVDPVREGEFFRY